MIKIRNLMCQYDNNMVFENLNLEIKDQDYLVITGANGSGKSTLLKALLGIVEFDKGDISIDGESIKKSLKKKKIGYVPQLDLHKTPVAITIREYLLLFTTRKRVDEIVKLIPIGEIIDKNINDLSGGQFQLLNIAKSLTSDVKYLILDEPNNGLDFNVRREIYNVLNILNEKGITIIIITHYVEEVNCHINKIFNMEKKEMEEVHKNDCQYC